MFFLKRCAPKISSSFVQCIFFRFDWNAFLISPPVDWQMRPLNKFMKWSRAPHASTVSKVLWHAAEAHTRPVLPADKLFRNKRNDERFNYKSFVSAWTHIIAYKYGCQLFANAFEYTRLMPSLSEHFSYSYGRVMGTQLGSTQSFADNVNANFMHTSNTHNSYPAFQLHSRNMYALGCVT